MCRWVSDTNSRGGVAGCGKGASVGGNGAGPRFFKLFFQFMSDEEA